MGFMAWLTDPRRSGSHTVRVCETPAAVGENRSAWTAFCACGWRGGQRWDPEAAFADARAHRADVMLQAPAA